MSKGRHPSHSENWERRQMRRHRQQYRRHKNNPCPHAPRTLDVSELDGELVPHPGGKRHNRWTAVLKWAEVNVDTDGFPLLIKGYYVRVEYSEDDGATWLFHQRLTVPVKDEEVDDNDTAHVVIHSLHAKHRYRFRVKAVSERCVADPSDFFDLGTPDDTPPDPRDVKIIRASHAIRLNWHAPKHPGDDENFTQQIAFFICELWTNADFGPVIDFTATAVDNYIISSGHGFQNGDPIMLSNTPGTDDLPDGVNPWKLYFVVDRATNQFRVSKTVGGSVVDLTSNGSGQAHWGLVRKALHEHRHHHNFEIDVDDFDEDTRFYGRVRSVSDQRYKSAWIPATADEDGNDDPEAVPDGRRPAWHRHVFEATILGDVLEGIYLTPTRVDDDYRIRRVSASFHHGGDGAYFDVKINGGPYVFDRDTAFMLELGAGEHDASTKEMVNKDLERGDHLRVYAELLGSDPPANGTIHVIADRIRGDGPTTDSGGGGDEGDSS